MLYLYMSLLAFWLQIFSLTSSYSDSRQNMSDTAPLGCDYGACFNQTREENASALNWIDLQQMRATEYVMYVVATMRLTL